MKKFKRRNIKIINSKNEDCNTISFIIRITNKYSVKIEFLGRKSAKPDICINMVIDSSVEGDKNKKIELLNYLNKIYKLIYDAKRKRL